MSRLCWQNHNPAAKNGAASAWDILSPIWASQSITVLGTTFKSPMGWLHYESGFGEVVDRYRWDAGCIAEHVRTQFSLGSNNKQRRP